MQFSNQMDWACSKLPTVNSGNLNVHVIKTLKVLAYSYEILAGLNPSSIPLLA